MSQLHEGRTVALYTLEHHNAKVVKPGLLLLVNEVNTKTPMKKKKNTVVFNYLLKQISCLFVFI